MIGTSRFGDWTQWEVGMEGREGKDGTYDFGREGVPSQGSAYGAGRGLQGAG
jgi:hypothetical protein